MKPRADQLVGLPKTLARLWEQHPGKIADITNEGADGYWIYLTRGFDRGGEQVHCVHEWTVAAAVKAFYEEVDDCDCEECC